MKHKTVFEAMNRHVRVCSVKGWLFHYEFLHRYHLAV